MLSEKSNFAPMSAFIRFFFFFDVELELFFFLDVNEANELRLQMPSIVDGFTDYCFFFFFPPFCFAFFCVVVVLSF